MNGTIERAKPEDLEAIFALYRSLANAPYSTWDDDYPSREIVEGDLAHNDVFVLRTEDGRIGAAIVLIQGWEHEEDHAPWYADVTRWCDLARLGVAKDMQGQGVARRMLAYAMEQGAAKGCEAVRFFVGTHNVPALRSYAKLGFEICGEARLWDEDWLCYEKRL